MKRGITLSNMWYASVCVCAFQPACVRVWLCVCDEIPARIPWISLDLRSSWGRWIGRLVSPASHLSVSSSSPLPHSSPPLSPLPLLLLLLPVCICSSPLYPSISPFFLSSLLILPLLSLSFSLSHTFFYPSVVPPLLLSPNFLSSLRIVSSFTVLSLNMRYTHCALCCVCVYLLCVSETGCACVCLPSCLP